MQDSPFLRCVARGIEVELCLRTRAGLELKLGGVPVGAVYESSSLFKGKN